MVRAAADHSGRFCLPSSCGCAPSRAVDTVTARSLLHSETVRWEDIDGLAFNKGSWARAQLKDGRELTLPAVTFSTLPQLTEVSAGRVPNPYG